MFGNNDIEEITNVGIEAHINREAYKITCATESWDSLDLYELSNASYPADKCNLCTDEQLERFKKLLIISTNFSSVPFAKKLDETPFFIQRLAFSLSCLKEKLVENRVIVNEFEDIVNFSAATVSEIKHSAKMIVVSLEAAVRHINVIGDVMSSNANNIEKFSFNKADKNDVKIALTRLSTGAKKLLDFSKPSGNILKSETRLTLNNILETKKQSLKNFCFSCGVPKSSFCNDIALTQVISKPIPFTVAEKLYPSLFAVIGSYALGACYLSVMKLVDDFWSKKEYKYLDDLSTVIEHLIQIDKANMKVRYCMANAEGISNAILSNIESIQVTLENNKQSADSKNICSAAVHSATAMIERLQKISLLDFHY